MFPRVPGVIFCHEIIMTELPESLTNVMVYDSCGSLIGSQYREMLASHFG